MKYKIGFITIDSLGDDDPQIEFISAIEKGRYIYSFVWESIENQASTDCRSYEEQGSLYTDIFHTEVN